MGTPSGSVAISLDGQNIGSITLDGNGNGTLSGTAPTQPGSHSVVGVYSGDSNFNGSQGSASFTIPSGGGLLPSVVTITASVSAGQLTITVNVAQGS